MNLPSLGRQTIGEMGELNNGYHPMSVLSQSWVGSQILSLILLIVHFINQTVNTPSYLRKNSFSDLAENNYKDWLTVFKKALLV